MPPLFDIGDLLHIRYNIIDPYVDGPLGPPEQVWVVGLVTGIWKEYGNRYIKINLPDCKNNLSIDINLDSPHYDHSAIRLLGKGTPI